MHDKNSTRKLDQDEVLAILEKARSQYAEYQALVELSEPTDEETSVQAPPSWDSPLTLVVKRAI